MLWALSSLQAYRWNLCIGIVTVEMRVYTRAYMCNCFAQVNTINLDSEVTFPNTAGSALATAAASSLYSTLSSNPGQVYTASGAALLTSATVAINNVTQATSYVTSLETPAAQIGPGPAPVQYLLTANLVSHACHDCDSVYRHIACAIASPMALTLPCLCSC